MFVIGKLWRGFYQVGKFVRNYYFGARIIGMMAVVMGVCISSFGPLSQVTSSRDVDGIDFEGSRIESVKHADCLILLALCETGHGLPHDL
jgi:hypothetical protein